MDEGGLILALIDDVFFSSVHEVCHPSFPLLSLGVTTQALRAYTRRAQKRGRWGAAAPFFRISQLRESLAI